MGSRQSRTQPRPTAAAYSPLDNISISVVRGRREIGVVNSRNSVSVIASHIPGSPVMVTIWLIVENNGPTIYAKSVSGFSLEAIDDGDALVIRCNPDIDRMLMDNPPLSNVYHLYEPRFTSIKIVV